MKKLLPLFIFIVFLQSVYAAKIAVTIDDLPFVDNATQWPDNLRHEKEHFLSIMNMLKKHHIPVAGFVVPGTFEKDQQQLIQAFYDNGNIIANHTYSHLNLNKVSAEKYINNVEQADKLLQKYMDGAKYFRYPFLAEGRGRKKQIVRDALLSAGYIIAPVTIDSKDYVFNEKFLNIPWHLRVPHLPTIKQQYLDFIWTKTQKAEAKAQQKMHRPVSHILLLHMNTLNAYVIEDIIKLYQGHDYHFITLAEAMQDPYNSGYH